MGGEANTQKPIQLLEMAARLAGVGHWHFHPATGKITWSAETYRIHGLPQTDDEPDYDRLLSLYSPESAKLLASLVERALTTGQGYELEATICRPDGAIRYVAAKAECSLTPQGTVESLFGVFQDITERSNAERFMRTLTNHIPGMVGYWDTDLRCRYANVHYLEWFGRKPQEMLGLSMLQLMGPELFARNEPYIRGAMSGEAQTFERTLVKPSGETRHTLARYIPDKDAAGDVVGMVALVTDITDLKNTELKLIEATKAKDEALAKAEAALATKSEFLSNISHELRNPLTGIIGFTSLLSDPSALSREDAASYLGRIRDAGTDLLTTVNDLLDFSKLTAGRVAIVNDPVDPFDVGLQALAFFAPQLDEKKLSHEFVAHALPSAVMADGGRLRQILLNLIGNAAKFTSAGAVNLIADFDEERSLLRYTVADTGPGIAPEHHARLFQRFFQVDSSSTRKSGGTGLGLAICKGLAEAMGGSVGFASEVGRGSEFWVEIPCAPVADRKAQRKDESGGVDALRGLRLLVVDDHPANRELVRRLLEPMDVQCHEARSGAEALELAAQSKFDVILLDMVMPEMDGQAVARVIRSGGGPNQATTTIAFTADVARELDPQQRDLFDARLSKPFTVAELLGVLLAHAPSRSGA